jgi:hypothetical protein
MMEAARTSETLVNLYQTTRRYNPEDSHLRTPRRENLKSYLIFSHVTKTLWTSNCIFSYPIGTCQFLGQGCTNDRRVKLTTRLHLVPKSTRTKMKMCLLGCCTVQSGTSFPMFPQKTVIFILTAVRTMYKILPIAPTRLHGMVLGTGAPSSLGMSFDIDKSIRYDFTETFDIHLTYRYIRPVRSQNNWATPSHFYQKWFKNNISPHTSLIWAGFRSSKTSVFAMIGLFMLDKAGQVASKLPL